MDVASSWMFSPMTAAHSCARVVWFNQAFLETEPLHPFGVSTDSRMAPPDAFWECGQKTQLRLQSASLFAVRAEESLGVRPVELLEAVEMSNVKNFSRFRQSPSLHALPMTLFSCGHVFFCATEVPVQRHRGPGAAMSLAVLMRFLKTTSKKF
jgi:hypothetical protein